MSKWERIRVGNTYVGHLGTVWLIPQPDGQVFGVDACMPKAVHSAWPCPVDADDDEGSPPTT